MPRGQYDRTKTKEQRAAEKAAAEKSAKPAKAAKAAKKTAGAKRGPKPGWKGKGKGSNAAATHSASDVVKGTGRLDQFVAINEVRSNIVTLNLVAEKFSDLPILKQEIEANIQLLGKLREDAWPTDTVDEEEETETVEAAGGNSTAPYAGNVPLPPSPVQVPGIPH